MAKKVSYIDITNDNIDDRIANFEDVINSENDRTSLRYFCDQGIINYPIKINFQITSSLEKNMSKRFEFKQKSDVVGTPDKKIILTHVPYIQFEQFKLNDNFRQCFETIINFIKVLSMEIQKIPLQKTYHMSNGSQSFNIDFLGANRQFD